MLPLTYVIILAREVLSAFERFLEKDIHPTVIVNAYIRAFENIVKITYELGLSPPFLNSLAHLFSIGSNQFGEQRCFDQNRQVQH